MSCRAWYTDTTSWAWMVALRNRIKDEYDLMPVLIDRPSVGHHSLKEEAHLLAASAQQWPEAESNSIDVGLINNMADSVLESTERQFVKLLAAASEDILVRLRFYSLPSIPRTASGRRHLNCLYFGIGELWGSHCDGLIVTGREPAASDLKDEPYWASLTEIVDWTEENSVITVWSCLAAHAAALHLDGVRRHALVDKRFGVFEYEKIADHPLLQDMQGPVRIPHSHFNEVREDDLTACGYTVLTRSASAGVDAFARHGKSLSIFFQGHPEYDADTLVHEYRRDIGRFLRRERDSYPAMPEGLFDSNAEDILTSYKDRALSNRREELLASFPAGLVPEGRAEKWRSPSARIYRNWLLGLSAQKKARQIRRVRSAT
jgi:homoserine O-succinyltransferase/O-acetyltransferase